MAYQEKVDPPYVIILFYGGLVLGSYEGKKLEYSLPIYFQTFSDTYHDILMNPKHYMHKDLLRRLAYQTLVDIHKFDRPLVRDGDPPKPNEPPQYKDSLLTTWQWTCENLEKLINDLTPSIPNSTLGLPPTWIWSRALEQLIKDGEVSQIGLPQNRNDTAYNALLAAGANSKLPLASDKAGALEMYKVVLDILKNLKAMLCPPPKEIPPSLLQELQQMAGEDETFGLPTWTRFVKNRVTTQNTPFY